MNKKSIDIAMFLKKYDVALKVAFTKGFWWIRIMNGDKVLHEVYQTGTIEDATYMALEDFSRSSTLYRNQIR